MFATKPKDGRSRFWRSALSGLSVANGFLRLVCMGFVCGFCSGAAVPPCRQAAIRWRRCVREALKRAAGCALGDNGVGPGI
ncbi:hypothetical protein [Neisseria iguanae]|uniref:hypothetical protein n=1 Tax=Neisseria iguanae TaxID=90242 RepID=UPI0011B23E51|nr:hypothetical protein [Neisseria iguanae]